MRHHPAIVSCHVHPRAMTGYAGGRPYKDIVQHSWSWVMEQWMFFLETSHWHVVQDALEGLIGGAAVESWASLQVLAVYLLN